MIIDTACLPVSNLKPSVYVCLGLVTMITENRKKPRQIENNIKTNDNLITEEKVTARQRDRGHKKKRGRE